MKLTKGRVAFNIINYTLLALIAVICVYPIWYVFAASMSGADYVNMGQVWLLPKGFTLDAYTKIIHRDGVWLSYFRNVGKPVFHGLRSVSAI